jgi:uncharacterized protein (TIGR03083 family)
MHTFADRVTRVVVESEALKHYLHILPPTAWDHPSACARWVIGDVVAHLAEGGAFYTESITRGLQGERAPFANRPPAGSVNGAAAAELMATRVLAARQRLGEGLLTAFDDTADRFTHLIIGLTAAEAETACYHPANLLAVRTFVGLRLCELVVHGWDIRSPPDPTAALSPESAAVLVEWWPEFVTWGFQPDTSLVTGGRFRFVFTCNGLPPYDLMVDGETVRMAPAVQGLAHVTFQCEAATFVLLMCGRHPLDTLMAEGRMVLEGDRGRLAAFRQWFQGM